jgi:hypothetical protein
MSGRPYYKPLLALLAVVMLFSVSFCQHRLNLQRPIMGIKKSNPLQNQDVPPILAFTTVAFGGFRGLIANLLWMRLNDLQQDEKFFEMVQLADWITKLQPHLVTVWVHQAWNMAYNISVKFPDAKDRWQWVQRGFQLLRDEGLRYNPDETLVYRELAWIYQHKMGANLDNAHMFYKQSWAYEMHQLLGGGRPNFDELMNPATDEARQRARTLRETYKLDPLKMKQVDEHWGPLEWRFPETHAIYWAQLGLEKSKPDQLITLRRVIYQSLDLASKRGRFIENRMDRVFEFGPNLEIIQKANDAYVQMLRDDKEYHDNIVNAHRNFLKQGIASYYTHNREADAAKLFQYARTTYTNLFTSTANLDTFVIDYVTEQANEGGVDRAQIIIEGFLIRHYYCTAIDEDDEAISYERMARKLWNRHQEKTARADRGRVDLPPYEDIKKEILRRILHMEIPRVSEAFVRQLCTKLSLPLPEFKAAPPRLMTSPNSNAGNTNIPTIAPGGRQGTYNLTNIPASPLQPPSSPPATNTPAPGAAKSAPKK